MGYNNTFFEYLRNNISSIVLAEGITEIPDRYFAGSYCSNFVLPSSLVAVDEMAFFQSQWLRNMWSDGFIDGSYQYVYVGNWKLAIDYWD